MPKSLTIVVPFSPDMQLSDNRQRRRTHWARAKVILDAREAFRNEALDSLGRSRPYFREKVTVSWRVMFGDKRHRDYENVVAALKPWLDVMCPDSDTHPGGLCIIQDDHSGIIKRYEVEIVEPDGSPGWTSLTITEVE